MRNSKQKQNENKQKWDGNEQRRFKIERKQNRLKHENFEKKQEFNKNKLKQDILNEAKVLGIAGTTAEMIAERSAEAVEKWMKGRAMVTQEDLSRKIADELEKYNADLAYVYKIRGRII